MTLAFLYTRAAFSKSFMPSKASVLTTAASHRPRRGARNASTKPASSENEEVPVKEKTKRKTPANANPPAKRRKQNDTLLVDHVTPQVTIDEKLSSSNEAPGYWLMKAEPETRIEKGIDVKFSIDDLQATTEPEAWEGVRNHVAKNNMMAMKKGELAFFYHSNCKAPGIAGIMEVAQESSPDKSAFDPKHPYYDVKSDPEKPRWFHVHVSFREKFLRYIPLKELQSHKEGELKDMPLLKQSRLSVSKVSKAEWDFILELSRQKEEDAST